MKEEYKLLEIEVNRQQQKLSLYLSREKPEIVIFIKILLFTDKYLLARGVFKTNNTK